MFKNTYPKKILAFCLAGALFFSSCEQENDAVIPEEPTLPSVETMLPDLSLFEDMETDGGTPNNGRTANFLPNATIAYINYVVWNTLLSIDMALPVAAFAESFNHDVTYDEANDRWVWAYSVEAGGDTYSARLFGTIAEEAFLWEMYASKEGDQGFQDVLWFSGTSDFDEKGGTWKIYRDSQAPKEHLDIVWSKDAQDNLNIRFTSLDLSEGSRIPKGSYVEYGVKTEGAFNFYYNLFFVQNNDLPADKLIEIRYNSETKEGSIRSEQDFNSNEWQCWNSKFEDTACQ